MDGGYTKLRYHVVRRPFPREAVASRTHGERPSVHLAALSGSPDTAAFAKRTIRAPTAFAKRSTRITIKI